MDEGAENEVMNYGATHGNEERSEEKNLEEVYEELGLGKAQYYTWTALMFVAFSDVSELVILAVLIPYLRCEWNLSLVFEVAIGCSVFFFYAIGGVLFGSLSDKIGRRQTILIAGFILSVSSFLSAASINKWMFLFTRISVGLCIGANFPTALVFSSEITCAKYKEYGVFSLLLIGNISLLVISIEAVLFLNTFGWRVFIIVANLPILIAIVILAMVPESPRYLVASGQEDEAKNALRIYFDWNNKPFPENLRIKTFNEERGTLSDVLKPQFRKETILLSIMYAGNIFLIFGLIVYLPFAVSRDICGGVGSGSIERTCKTLTRSELLDLAFISAAGLFAVTLGLLVAKKLGRVWPIKAFGIIVFLFTASLLVCININFTKAAFFFIKFFACAFNIIIWIIIPEIYPTVIRNTATGVINFWGKSAGAISTFLVYFLYSFSPLYVIIGFVIASLFSMIGGILWWKETKDATYEEVIADCNHAD